MDIEEQYDKLLRYCTMRLRDRALAEDVTQETLLRFWESRSYRDTGKEMAYLYTIARNLCIDCGRKPRETLLEDSLPEPENLPAPGDALQQRVEKLAIEQALGRLEPEERECIVLRYIAELSAGGVAEVTGLSRFAVRRRISSGLDKLRKELAEE